MNHTFCAYLSREQSDPLAGSAAHTELNLLLSWPRSKWMRNLRHAIDMADALKERLDAIATAGRRVNLIHRRDQDSELHQVFLMPERRRFSIPREGLIESLASWQAGEPLHQWEQRPIRKDLLLCCTHGKKDKCFAKYGYQTYKALAQAITNHKLPFEIWDSSHLGGCRLAASLILLLNVRKYGRITPAQVLSFLHAETIGQRYLPG